MNRRHEWGKLLKMANDDLKQFGYEIKLSDDGFGSFDCDILKDGKVINNYAGGYYEDELDGLVTDAWHDIKLKLV